MEKFNVRTNDGLREVKGELVQGTLGLKMFVYKSYVLGLNSHNWTVSEFYTGMSLHYGKTKHEAIENVLKSERNIDYWNDVDERIKYNNDLVNKILADVGYANKDETVKE
jgi:hypothetical protein